MHTGETTMSETGTYTTFSTLMNLAECELAAFIGVVGELYGPEQAALSADDWLEELELVDIAAIPDRAWRPVTIAAAVRLASRLTDTRKKTPFNARTPAKVSDNTFVQ